MREICSQKNILQKRIYVITCNQYAAATVKMKFIKVSIKSTMKKSLSIWCLNWSVSVNVLWFRYKRVYDLVTECTNCGHQLHYACHSCPTRSSFCCAQNNFHSLFSPFNVSIHSSISARHRTIRVWKKWSALACVPLLRLHKRNELNEQKLVKMKRRLTFFVPRESTIKSCMLAFYFRMFLCLLSRRNTKYIYWCTAKTHYVWTDLTVKYAISYNFY